MLLLMQNYGFVMNRAPVVSDTIPAGSTHVDLPLTVDLSTVAGDPDGDPVIHRITGATHGTAELAPDGTAALFTPEPGYTGSAGFQVIADDGFASSVAATVPVTISDAALVCLRILNRRPHLDVGQQEAVAVVGDFVDETDVPLHGSYVAFSSTDPAVATVSAEGVIAGVAPGSAAVTVVCDGVRAATAVSVGELEEIEDLYVDVFGIDVYPATLAFGGPGDSRQLLVRIAEDGDLDVTGAAAGTLYLSENQDVAVVSADGLVTAAALGETTVTVIHGPAETLVPVTVRAPQIGPTSVGPDGAVVGSGDGYVVAVGPDTLAEETAVSIESVAAVDLPMDLPVPFDFVGGFELDVGEDELPQPVQITAPSGGLPEGESVYFFRASRLPDENGDLMDVWILVESGIVGGDGLVHTSSPPYPGLSDQGTYLIANANRPVENVTVNLSNMSPGTSATLMASMSGGAGWGVVTSKLAANIMMPAASLILDLYWTGREQATPAKKSIPITELPQGNTISVTVPPVATSVQSMPWNRSADHLRRVRHRE